MPDEKQQPEEKRDTTSTKESERSAQREVLRGGGRAGKRVITAPKLTQEVTDASH